MFVFGLFVFWICYAKAGYEVGYSEGKYTFKVYSIVVFFNQKGLFYVVRARKECFGPLLSCES